ncbi:unnamed protein product, partial [Amoebophrya sp. A25]
STVIKSDHIRSTHIVYKLGRHCKLRTQRCAFSVHTVFYSQHVDEDELLRCTLNRV